jgi:branched-subunit amino acid aminotransferase/4-amino-4-deoxychorismate lyase
VPPTVFTTLLIEDGHIHHLEDHLQRLSQHAAILKIPIPVWHPHYLRRYLSNYNLETGQHRLKIFLNEDNYSFEVTPYQPKALNGYKLAVHPTPITTPPIKHHPYTNRDEIFHAATSQGFDDALTVSKENYILETAYANIFWQANNQLFTPDPSLPLLHGITLKHLEQRFSFNYIRLPLSELPANANLYLCNSLRKVQPILSIENKQFPRDFGFEKKLSTM